MSRSGSDNTQPNHSEKGNPSLTRKSFAPSRENSPERGESYHSDDDHKSEASSYPSETEEGDKSNDDTEDEVESNGDGNRQAERLQVRNASLYCENSCVDLNGRLIDWIGCGCYFYWSLFRSSLNFISSLIFFYSSSQKSNVFLSPAGSRKKKGPNQHIVDQLEEMMKQYRDLGDEFRTYAYVRAISSIRKYPDPIRGPEVRALLLTNRQSRCVFFRYRHCCIQTDRQTGRQASKQASKQSLSRSIAHAIICQFDAHLFFAHPGFTSIDIFRMHISEYHMTFLVSDFCSKSRNWRMLARGSPSTLWRSSRRAIWSSWPRLPKVKLMLPSLSLPISTEWERKRRGNGFKWYISQWINEWINQSINQSINQAINQSINSQVDQSTVQPTSNELIYQLIDVFPEIDFWDWASDEVNFYSGLTDAGRRKIESATDSGAGCRLAVLRRIQGKNDTPRSGADCGDCRADSEQHQSGIYFPGLWQLPARSTVDRGRRSPHDPPGWSLSWNHHETPSSSAAWNEWVMSGFSSHLSLVLFHSSKWFFPPVSFIDLFRWFWMIDWLIDCLIVFVWLLLFDWLVAWFNDEFNDDLARFMDFFIISSLLAVTANVNWNIMNVWQVKFEYDVFSSIWVLVIL